MSLWKGQEKLNVMLILTHSEEVANMYCIAR